MLKAFNRTIKPFNDALGETLGIKKISVDQFSMLQEIPVNVQVLGPNGKTFVKNTKLQACRILGLSVRSIYE